MWNLLDKALFLNLHEVMHQLRVLVEMILQVYVTCPNSSNSCRAIILMLCYSIYPTPNFVLQQLKSRLVEHHEEVLFAGIMPTCGKYLPTMTFHFASSCSRILSVVNTRINAARIALSKGTQILN